MSRATKAETMNPVVAVPSVKETEVLAKAKRRGFTAEYKQRILNEVDQAVAAGRSGEVGAILRREGLYSSHLAAWRRLREAGELPGLTPRKRGPKAKPVDALLGVQKSLGTLRDRAAASSARRGALVSIVTEEAKDLGVKPLCEVLGLPRATFYRRSRPRHGPVKPRKQPRGLTADEKSRVLAVLTDSGGRLG